LIDVSVAGGDRPGIDPDCIARVVQIPNTLVCDSIRCSVFAGCLRMVNYSRESPRYFECCVGRGRQSFILDPNTFTLVCVCRHHLVGVVRLFVIKSGQRFRAFMAKNRSWSVNPITGMVRVSLFA